MTKTAFLLSLATGLIFSNAFAQTPPSGAVAASTAVPVSTRPACPDISANSAGAPVCPVSGLLPETYPIGAVVVSDAGYRNSATNFEGGGRESQFTADVVIKALQGAGDNLPVIILPVAEETMTVINNRIAGLSVPQATKDRYLAALRHVPSPVNRGYTWQQDYMQSFVDPRTGRPMLRHVQGYETGQRLNRTLYSTDLISNITQCGIVSGPDLVPVGPNQGGHMGGNIEALPGGICVLGNDHIATQAQWQGYMDQVCRDSSPSARIQAPTDWLTVGHTDEILKTIRNHSKPPPCDFSVVVASPRKAIQLLEQNPNEPFMDFSGGRGGTAVELTQRRALAYPGLAQVCYQILMGREGSTTPAPSTTPSPSPGPAPSPSGRGQGISLNNQIQLLLFGVPAFAEVPRDTENICTGITNGDVARVLSSDSDLGRYNRLIQQKMENLKEEIHNKISQRIPGCEADIIEAPDAFFGGVPFRQRDGTYALPAGKALSILPNPTNAISINDTMITPEPGNNVFKNYLSEQYRARGLTPEYVDTFDYAHMGMGNLHCSTNTIHLCTPQGSRQ